MPRFEIESAKVTVDSIAPGTGTVIIRDPFGGLLVSIMMIPSQTVVNVDQNGKWDKKVP